MAEPRLIQWKSLLLNSRFAISISIQHVERINNVICSSRQKSLGHFNKSGLFLINSTLTNQFRHNRRRSDPPTPFNNVMHRIDLKGETGVSSKSFLWQLRRCELSHDY